MSRLIAWVVATVLEALRGSWQMIDGIWKWIRGSGSVPAVMVDVEPMPICQVEPIEVGLKKWFASGGGLQPLPNGIAPVEASWAASLKGHELEIAGRSSPSLIRAHLDGREVITGVRPVVANASDEAEQERRRAKIRARGAHITKALERTKAAYEARQEASAALAM